MRVLSGAAVDLRRSELIAGEGADGEPGERGGEAPAQGGTPGNAGDVAITTGMHGKGGPGGSQYVPESDGEDGIRDDSSAFPV